MNILILSTSHPYKTAGVIVKDLCIALNQRGHNAKLMVKIFDNYQNKNIINYHSKFEYLIYKNYNKIKNKLLIKRNLNKRVNPDYRVQTFNQTKKLVNTKRIIKKIGFKPDVILIYFTQNFINFVDIYNLYKKIKTPIFFIVPDMALFTGLCHYSWNCTNYQDTCGKCPAIYSDIQSDISRKNLESKLKLSKKMNLITLCVSDWLIKKIQKSALFKEKTCIKIPSTITRTEFIPAVKVQKNLLRNKYGIEQDSFVISFGALTLKDKRKGIYHIVSAINILQPELLNEKKVTIIISGAGPLPKELLVSNVKFFGVLDWSGLVEFYQISDLFISASIQDVGPATIIESMLCGIPVVSYDTGVAKDWIITKKTGYLSKNEDIKDLNKGIRTFLNMSVSDYSIIRKNCIEYSKKNNDRSKYYQSIEKIISDFVNT